MEKQAAGEKEFELNFLDAPSGDFFWMPRCLKHISAELPLGAKLNYQGVDISEIASNLFEQLEVLVLVGLVLEGKGIGSCVEKTGNWLAEFRISGSLVSESVSTWGIFMIRPRGLVLLEPNHNFGLPPCSATSRVRALRQVQTCHC